MQDGFLNVTEAADFLGLSASTLNKMRITGSGPRFLKPCRRVVYDRAALAEWMQAHERSSTSEAPPKDSAAGKRQQVAAAPPVASYAPAAGWPRARERAASPQ